MNNTEAHKLESKRRMKIMLMASGLLFGGIILFKIVSMLIMTFIMKNHEEIAAVSTTKVAYAPWQPQLKAVGSTRAIFKGVNVTTELAGMVREIYFTPGQIVKKGDLLVQLNADTEQGTLAALKAQQKLAEITYHRDKAQFAISAVSKQALDNDEYNLKNLTGQVASQEATVQKKAIRAPFSGKLGIATVNYGQFLNPGDKIVSLQQLDPIWVDFTVPQENLPQLSQGMPATVKIDGLPQSIFQGKISAIDPVTDPNTRNVTLEATIPNPALTLLPGMFGRVTIDTGKPSNYLTLPQTAISYNPYGDIVYIVHHHKKFWHEEDSVEQAFIETGDARGDQIIVTKGLKVGDEVVTSGQLKLKNGSRVKINNTISISNSITPDTPDDR